MGVITSPTPITSAHDITAFQCGTASLDEWLRKRAISNQQSNASRTFVVCDGERVAGYYALATGSIERAFATGGVARNMPDPIPVIILGRLAVDQSYNVHGIGAALLRDALLRSVGVSDQVGTRAVLVHALSEAARRFYEKYGFSPSPMAPMTLMLSIRQIRAHLMDN